MYKNQIRFVKTSIENHFPNGNPSWKGFIFSLFQDMIIVNLIHPESVVIRHSESVKELIG